MSKTVRPLIVSFLLVMTILACAVPQIPPIGQPTPGGGTALPPGSPDLADLGTAVALTLTAYAPPPGASTATSPATVTTVPPTENSSAPLPHSLYYLANDSADTLQVFRVETDGTTRSQITSETVNVTDYDVSPVDGGVAYVANNELVYVNSYGSERRVLMDGGAVDPNNPFITTLSSPVFAPDGQSIAYGYRGLQIYSFVSDKSTLLIRNEIEDTGGGLFVPRELYAPERYSPNGTKLLLTLGYYEGASSAIYDPATRDLVRLNGGEGALICCEETKWSFDSSSVYAASPSMGMFSSGLWKVDALTGDVATLLPGDAGEGSYNAADEAYLAPDGQLYFFFATFTTPEARAPLQLVRSAPDGVTGRTVISERDFQLLNEALWAPSASLVVIVLASSPEMYRGGQAEVIYLDGRPGFVLAPSALQMKWGP